jgi:dolichol-phosphate mannosyltransferase
MEASVWIVIPTYNEAENLEPLIRSVLEVMRRCAPDRHRILVVDDNSPDGTGRVADRLANEVNAVEVLHRPAKAGLGHAYLAGFARALNGGAQFVVEMDADFSHDPHYLPDLLEAADSADLVLGSRYVDGGGCATGACCGGSSAGVGAYTRGSSFVSTSRT